MNEFREATEARWRLRSVEGRTGGQLDQEYDAIYENIRRLATTVERQMDKAIEEDWRLSAGTSIAINLLVLALVATVAVVALRKRG